jgi:hypothetical protein
MNQRIFFIINFNLGRNKFMGIELLLGHLVGDYLLQTNKMATTKKDKGIYGFLACFIHCLLYTLAICVFVGYWSWLGIALVFLSHWIVDRYKWLHYIHTKFYGRPGCGEDSPIGTFVYIAMDNTIHLVLIYLIYWLI